jgi:hypothetical protein
MCVVAGHAAGKVDEHITAWLDEAAALVDALPDGDLVHAKLGVSRRAAVAGRRGAADG